MSDATITLELVGARLTALTADTRDLKQRFSGLEARFGALEGRFGALERRFATHRRAAGCVRVTYSPPSASMHRVTPARIREPGTASRRRSGSRPSPG